MKNKLLIISSSVLLLSCTHKSELKHESGVVVEKQFSPEFSGSGIGTGYSSNGDVSVNSTNIHKSEQFMLVIKCEHNTVFTIDRKQLYCDLEKGDTLDIQYYEILNDNNESEGFDFVTATKK